MQLSPKKQSPSYEVNDTVSFDQGTGKFDKAGIGKIKFAQDYPLCYAYSIEMKDGTLVQVLEQDIKEIVNDEQD